VKIAEEIMTRAVVTVNKNLAIKELSKLFIENRFNGVPVVDDDDNVIGVVTQGDLIEQNKNLHIPTVITLFDAVLFLDSEKKFESDVKKLTGTTVEDIYHKHAISVGPTTSISEITTLMAEKDIHTLPVLDDDKLVGVIGKRDVIRALA